MSLPRFVIINDSDAPAPHMVCQLTKIGYCYMDRYSARRRHVKSYDGMRPGPTTTSMEDFGFEISERRGVVYFRKTSESRATYRDGQSRHWQSCEEEFELPLVRDARRKKERV